jgi:hypothetical protein
MDSFDLMILGYGPRPPRREDRTVVTDAVITAASELPTEPLMDPVFGSERHDSICYAL